MRIHAPIDNATSTACFRHTLLFPTREGVFGTCPGQPHGGNPERPSIDGQKRAIAATLT